MGVDMALQDGRAATFSDAELTRLGEDKGHISSLVSPSVSKTQERWDEPPNRPEMDHGTLKGREKK